LGKAWRDGVQSPSSKALLANAQPIVWKAWPSRKPRQALTGPRHPAGQSTQRGIRAAARCPAARADAAVPAAWRRVTPVASSAADSAVPSHSWKAAAACQGAARSCTPAAGSPAFVAAAISAADAAAAVLYEFITLRPRAPSPLNGVVQCHLAFPALPSLWRAAWGGRCGGRQRSTRMQLWAACAAEHVPRFVPQRTPAAASETVPLHQPAMRAARLQGGWWWNAASGVGFPAGCRRLLCMTCDQARRLWCHGH
jgi:hypothetical protein